jgi:putative cardiolipin synthase
LAAACVLLAVLAALGGCAPLRGDLASPQSSAFDRPRETTLGLAHAALHERHGAESGFRVLNNGVSALMTRAALADLAERSIDFQTFIFDADGVGAFVLDRLIAAARRGVRVRILLDDYELGLDDRILARIDAEPNVEVRLFNPYPDRARWSRPLQMAFDLDRLGRRMHNKLQVVDGQAVLLGGRNISNHYFEGASDANFRDVELLAVGPVAAEAAGSFDSFWNSAIVRPVKALGQDGRSSEADGALTEVLRRGEGEVGAAAEYRRRGDVFRRQVLEAQGLIWAKSRVVAEPPVRREAGAAKPSAEIARAHAIARQGAATEVIYETAYFVPGDRGVEVLGDLTRRGVAVSVLTNSLAATDMVPVHAYYARYRPALLAAGIRLYEYRVDANRPEPAGHVMRPGRSESALHAKMVVYDRRLVWVGSANFDPRSRRLNTEIGVMIDSEEMAAQMLSRISLDFSPRHSWRVEPGDEPGRLVWTGEQDGREIRLHDEPDLTPWRAFKALFYGVLPGIEELL